MLLKQSECKNLADKTPAKGTVIQVGEETQKGVEALRIFGRRIQTACVAAYDGKSWSDEANTWQHVIIDIRTGKKKTIFGEDIIYRKIPGVPKYSIKQETKKKDKIGRAHV